jgi:hypothetical protein
MALLEKLKKSSKLSGTQVLSESDFFTHNELTPTAIPMINVALSGRIDGGLGCGTTVLAGPSKHFKTSFALLMAQAYLKAHEDSVLLFYDSEFGSPQKYFESFGIDTERVLHTPIMNIEELKFDLVHQLEELDPKDNVIIVIDSIGNLASKKEVDDALNEKSVADMTRAKALKGLFRMITPYLQTKYVPLLAVNHTYKEQSMFPKDIVSGGTGVMYSADSVWIIGRQQDKKGTEIQGYHFIINVEKSRFVREKSKIPISVSWEGGIMKWSGLLDVALESGWVKKPKQGWYAVYAHPDDSDPVGKSVREKDTQSAEFWKPLLTNSEFTDWIENRYAIGEVSMFNEEEKNEEA